MSDVTLKEYFEALILAQEKANNQRFSAQEKAIETAEHSRDVAIKKAEDSIEKKSDAVYVKVTDLESALAKVMLRPEVESRFTDIARRMGDLETSRATVQGKGEGKLQLWGLIVGGFGFLAAIVALASRFL